MTVVGMVAVRSPALYLVQPAHSPGVVTAKAASSAQSGAPARIQGSAHSKKTQPSWAGKEPLGEKLRLVPNEGKVELFTLFTSIDIQKDYGKFTMVYDGRAFRKLERGVRGSQVPKPGEIMHFVKDILEAAKGDVKIRDFLEDHPLRVPAHLRKYLSF